jgi:ABC-2 type transport system permease protein
VSKLVALARKEILLAFRDRGALISMLLTPFVLTLAIGAAFGGGGDQPLRNVPVLLLNRDQGALAAHVVEAFESLEMEGLVLAELVNDEAAARQRVDRDEVAALVILPADFSARMLAATAPNGAGGAPSLVEIYASPSWRIGTALIQAIVAQVLEGMHMGIQGVHAAIGQLAEQAAAPPAQLAALGETMGQALLEAPTPSRTAITLAIDTAGYRPFRWLDYSAASMAVLFMMFAAMSGGRSLLHEREGGTLPRLLITPNRPLVILVGKMAGVAATGVLQMVILWQATGLLGAYWGDALPAIVAILALVICATGLGALIAAWARTPSQAGALGTAITLAGAALSGSFFPRSNLPAWVRTLSLATPNAWGIELFGRLQVGSGLAEVAPYLAGTLALALVYYVAATLGFRRQFSA